MVRVRLAPTSRQPSPRHRKHPAGFVFEDKKNRIEAQRRSPSCPSPAWTAGVKLRAAALLGGIGCWATASGSSHNSSRGAARTSGDGTAVLTARQSARKTAAREGDKGTARQHSNRML